MKSIFLLTAMRMVIAVNLGDKEVPENIFLLQEMEEPGPHLPTGADIFIHLGIFLLRHFYHFYIKEKRYVPCWKTSNIRGLQMVHGKYM